MVYDFVVFVVYVIKFQVVILQVIRITNIPDKVRIKYLEKSFICVIAKLSVKYKT